MTGYWLIGLALLAGLAITSFVLIGIGLISHF